MKVLEDGRYQLVDGRILTPTEVADLYKTAPRDTKISEDKKKQELGEGCCSGPIPLCD